MNSPTPNNENNINELTGDDYNNRYIYYLNEYNDPFVQELLANPSTPLDVDSTLRLINLVITPENMIAGRIPSITKTGDGLSFSISSLQSYPLLQTLNVSEDVLIMALNKSKYIYNEETKLVNMKFERKTVVLLNAPEDTTEEEIKQFFGDLSSEISETRRDIENSWFITFHTEDNAVDAVIKCRGRVLKDTKVNVRIKSESVLKNISFQEQPSFMSESYYGTGQWYYDGYQYYNSYQGEYYPYDNFKPFKHGQNSRFRGGKGRKYGTSRHDTKDSTNIPLQIMGNGEIVYGKKTYNKGHPRKGHVPKRGEKRSGHQAPPLGVSHFPPLGTSPRNSNVKRISRDEIISLHDKALDVSGEIKESPVVSEVVNSELATTNKIEGSLKNDILDAKWWDNNQKRSKSAQRRRPKSNASEHKPQLLHDPNTTTRSSSVGKKRRDSSAPKNEANPVNKEEGQNEISTPEKVEETIETTTTTQDNETKPKWADIFSFNFISFKMDSSQLNCRMYEEKYPEVDQIVMVKVTQIAEMGAYVSLLEYNNIEGMILLSELSRKRIRSINKLIKVGRKEVVTVLRVDKEKGYIDLSKRRVGSEDVAAMEEKFAKSKAVHSIMKHVAKSENAHVEKLYEQFGWPLYKKYEHAYNAFKLALQDPDEVFGDLVPQGELRDKLLATIKHRLTRKPVKIRADIEISCFEYSGIDAIKEALLAGKECSTDPETPIIIHLVASPLYVIYVTSLDKAQGIELVQTAIETIQDKIESFGGTLEVKVEPRAVTESDDFSVDSSTTKGEQNESDSDDD